MKKNLLKSSSLLQLTLPLSLFLIIIPMKDNIWIWTNGLGQGSMSSTFSRTAKGWTEQNKLMLEGK